MDPRDTHLLGKITNPNTPWFQRWRNRRKFAARYFRPDLFEARRAKTVALIEREVRPTERLYASPDELRGLPAYATVVVGSDQVWNPLLNTDFGRNQYLATDLPDGQDRVAYAASFGVSEIPESLRGEYAAALGRFRRITVREETGAAICESLLGRRPTVVLDPTMLLSADEWRAATARRGASAAEGPYAAAYWVRSVTQADVDALAAFARARGLPVRLMSAGFSRAAVLSSIIAADERGTASEAGVPEGGRSLHRRRSFRICRGNRRFLRGRDRFLPRAAVFDRVRKAIRRAWQPFRP